MLGRRLPLSRAVPAPARIETLGAAASATPAKAQRRCGAVAYTQGNICMVSVAKLTYVLAPKSWRNIIQNILNGRKI